jgi:hypothetical protein
MLFTQTLTRKLLAVRTYLIVALLTFSSVRSQDAGILDYLPVIEDAIFFTDKYITPANDAAVYQAASGWMVTPKKRAFGDVTLALNFNYFFVPKSDRSFRISNSDFFFFKIDDSDTAITPTALGNDQYVTLRGTMANGDEITMKSPEGIDRENIMYPYIQGSVALWKGTEVIAKFAPRTVLKHVLYQVYGAGLKHNLNQYFANPGKYHFAALGAYSREDVSVEFMEVQAGSAGSLGLNSLNTVIDTWQLQVNASRDIGKLELSAGMIYNYSDFVYALDGNKGDFEYASQLRGYLNSRFEKLSKTKSNYIGEVAGRYDFRKVFVQGTVAFGKFVNTNLSVQYEF